MATRKPYQVRIREEGRGRPTIEAFGDLTSASAFIRSYWQGSEYRDGNNSFHTDYATFELVGFNFGHIGQYVFEDGFYEYRFDDAADEDEQPEDNGDYQSSYHR